MEQVEVGKYQPYPEYKDSGVEWLGLIPKHWALRRAKFIFQRIQRPVRDIDGIVTAFRDGQVTLRSNRRIDGFTNALQEIGYQGVRKGDLLIHAMDGFAGAIGISDSDGKCSPVCSVCTPISKTLAYPAYYGYLIRQLAVTGFITSLSKGIRERSTEFRFSEFSPLGLALPPHSEQRTIAAFLDYETARIDKLIAQQQRLIDLLKEKRQAVISHAVTKGLNPDAPMKDSGVEWLGEVPEHWLVSSLKFIYKNLDYKRIPLSAEERGSKQGDYPYYGASGIIDSIDDYLFSTDHVLVGEDGANLVMRSTPIAFVATGQYWVNNHAHILRMNDGLNSYWAAVIENLDISPFVTGSAQPKLTAEALGNLIVAYPKTLQERIEIQEFINREKPKFTTLIDRAEHQVHLLKERRTALISAAVTGKIDLRGWTASTQEAAA
ncbi:restriction endonuclease subunit S [Cronobacter sakazakii]|uniref:restriction endonuclease subunit S n=1 Tax=Enterobacteriaceae TaxID=543 RepID=UPI0009BB019F|nr:MULTISPECIES: restriction endonuclease subunit S [Enterobacteriaceae]MDK1221666.1 restriction endonuclease subunit S [Cronobacter turicensis]EGT0042295.1 restriction endonuclease subunit S [Cronobacter sakazakii]EGT4277188.1 restriction endonuclease subunit S [Cronobacter sakazakii]EGT5694640.1 restriction endonuclease subunit S [Cronobacter sakazakii]EGT5721389.1 restriction endonuclease subunit S [Cronobacter sakazakii]